jgi:DNA-directed RNA polymerase subunit RPC12/RpoP
MITPININPLNVTKDTYCECANCGFKVKIYWKNKLINTDSEFDMENILYEPCPKCGKLLGSRDNFKELLIKRVQFACDLCDYMQKKQSFNIDLLMEYKKVFENFLESEKIDDLKEINKIFYRPSLEGAETDFTTVTIVNFTNKSVSLGDQLMQIQNLITNIEQAV